MVILVSWWFNSKIRHGRGRGSIVLALLLDTNHEAHHLNPGVEPIHGRVFYFRHFSYPNTWHCGATDSRIARPGHMPGNSSPGPGGRVVMLRSAKPPTPVRFRPWPPILLPAALCRFPPLTTTQMIWDFSLWTSCAKIRPCARCLHCCCSWSASTCCSL